MINWIGLSRLGLMAALLGSAAGFAAYVVLFRLGLEAPWVVALGAGTAVAVVSRESSVPRGLCVGALAVWVAAAAQLWCAGGGARVAELLGFYHTVDLARLGQFALAGVVSVYLSSRALAKRRGVLAVEQQQVPP